MTIFIYIVLCLIWGSTWIGIKIGLEDAPPVTTAIIRFVIALSILYAIILFKQIKFPTTFKDILKLAYPGLYMYGVSYTCVYLGEQYISSALTSVLFASFPLFVALLSIKMLRSEKLTSFVWAGLVLGFLGIVVISYDSLQISGNLFLGCILILAASYVSAYGMVLHKKSFSQCDIFMATALQQSIGVILMLLYVILFENWRTFVFTPTSVGSILYLAIFGSVIAFLGYYWLLKHTTAVVVSLIAFITPVVAIFIGVGLFSEKMTTGTWVGSAMILGGIILVVRRQQRSSLQEQRT